MSLNQFIIGEDYNWAWYYNKILNQKTLNFFLSPIVLSSLSPITSERYDQLKNSFLLLNSAYLHWQLVDDVADLIEDTNNGVVTAPGYLLISQGQLAKQLKPFIDMVNKTHNSKQNITYVSIESDVIHSISQSFLLIKEFEYSPVCREFFNLMSSRHIVRDRTITLDRVVAFAKCALANEPSELDLPLNDLCVRRIHQKECFIEGMATYNYKKGLQAILDSKVAFRIIFAIDNQERILQLRKHLCIVKKPYLLNVMRILNNLISRAYIRALRIATMQSSSLEKKEEKE